MSASANLSQRPSHSPAVSQACIADRSIHVAEKLTLTDRDAHIAYRACMLVRLVRNRFQPKNDRGVKRARGGARGAVKSAEVTRTRVGGIPRTAGAQTRAFSRMCGHS
eukprot:3940533-Rhodomonas_salina.2